MPDQHNQSEATYRRYLPSLQAWAGWFALVSGERLGGVFPDYAAAATAWMAMYGPVPALIRRIEPESSAASDGTAPVGDAAGTSSPTKAKDERYGTRGIGRPLPVSGNWGAPIGGRQKAREYAA